MDNPNSSFIQTGSSQPVADRNADELVRQVKLVASIFSGRKTFITPSEARLLRIDPENAEQQDWSKVQVAAEEVFAEVLLAVVPAPPQVIDLRLVAVNLLRQIKAAGGMIERKDAGLPEELIKQLEQEGILLHADGGLRWGRFAAQAVKDVEAEYENEITPVNPPTGTDVPNRSGEELK